MGRPRRAAAPELRLLFQHAHAHAHGTLNAQRSETRLTGRRATQTKAGRWFEMGRNVADLATRCERSAGGVECTHTKRPTKQAGTCFYGQTARLAPRRLREMILEPVDPPRNHPWMGPWDTTQCQPLVRSQRSRPPVSRYAEHANTPNPTRTRKG